MDHFIVLIGFVTIWLLFYILFFVFFFLPQGTWDLSPLIRDETHNRYTGIRSLNHWTAGEMSTNEFVKVNYFLNKIHTHKIAQIMNAQFNEFLLTKHIHPHSKLTRKLTKLNISTTSEAPHIRAFRC